MVTNALGLGQDIAEGGNLGPELIEFEGSRELVGQLISRCLVRVIFILFRVG